MPQPTEERVSQLVAGLVEGRGFDLEGVEITAKGSKGSKGSKASSDDDEFGAQSVKVQVIVDSDGGSDLDTLAALSRQLSEFLDEADEFGETPYLLEVSTPGVDRPLTAARHWQRARGRKVLVRLREGATVPGVDGVSFEARVGALDGETVALVLGGKRNPHRVPIPLADIAEAVVQVEFSPPSGRELELAGGVAPGRPGPGTEEPVAVDDSAPARPNTSVPATDSTEGIVE
ncbi:ribosome maturation factor RimP [Nocardia callitridis]|uniref:Ribosome maturation factor RimP n=1 Tax=Nocardia callitridis TaxID=648753 RepID=A0ABP9KF08_9NOCA